MLAILPFLALGFWTAGFLRRGFGGRQSIVFASLPCAIFVAYSTECLSAFHAIGRLGLSCAWLAFGLLAGAWALAGKPGVPGSGISDKQAKAAPGVALDAWDWAALAFAAALVAIVGVTALVSAPNTWDAMEYHLPRVVEWIGHRGVQFYPTIDRQQLTMPSMSEYAMMHLDVLWGSDRLVNLVQWFAYLGSIAGVSLVVEEMGGDRRTQAFAALLAVTIPVAMLSASGAKNDNGLAYWMVVAVYLLLQWRRRQNWWLAMGIGASISLAIFTKGTAYVFLPFPILACWMMCGGRARWRLILRIPVFAAILLSVCGPLWLRNYRMTGSVLGLPYFDGAGSIEGRKFANSHLGPAQAVAGVVRNVAVNLALPSKKINALTTRAASGLMWAIGVDPNDFDQITRAQSGLQHPFAVDFHYRDEILAGNQWNFLLFLLACGLYLARWRTRKKEPGWLALDWPDPGWLALGWLALGLIGAFLLFSVLLRWCPWNGRFQNPVFTLSVVFVAPVLAQALPRWANRAVVFALLVACLPLALMNDMRPWIAPHGLGQTLLKLPRDRTYFLDSHEYLADSYLAAASSPAVGSCKSIGLDANLLHYEYPMMALIEEKGRNWPDRSFAYLSVSNPTAAYADSSAPAPCVVVCLGCAGSDRKMRQYGANRTVETYGPVVVFSNGGLPVQLSQTAATRFEAPSTPPIHTTEAAASTNGETSGSSPRPGSFR